MARKTAIDKAIEELGAELRESDEAFRIARAAHDARLSALAAAIATLRKQQATKRTRKPKAVTPQTAA